MGGSQSREGLDLSDSSDYEDDEEHSEEQYDDAQDHDDRQQPKPQSSSGTKTLDELDAKLKALKLKYPYQNPNLKNAVKLYLHVGGNTPKAKWVVSDKLTSYEFVKNEDDDDSGGGERYWVLKVGSNIRARVSTDMQLKMFGDQRRIDFVWNGVWALKFFGDEEYRSFVTQFQDFLFENVYGLKPTDDNKVKVYGKEFLGWVKPEAADDSMWEDAEDGVWKSPAKSSVRARQDLLEEFEEAAIGGGIQSLALGALDNSFLVNDSGVQVVKNFSHGIHGKGVYVKFDSRGQKSSSSAGQSTPKKALLMRGETNMLLMSPLKEGKPQATGLHQLDIETGKIVTEWKFEKDGTDITMRDITNDTKGSQLDPSESTFLGLDDNRLCQWDMREKKGMVQNIATANSPVLHWTQGHQFSRGTNFQSFATTGEGSIVVGSLDGKIRLYSKTSMRQAKTAFPGLGLPITYVDVTYDGKWVLGTTDSYLILICTLFTDKDGKTKTGFGGRMGNKIPAPRLLKLTPVDSHMAGTDNKFQRGQFSWVTENGKQERHLVATVGKFSVIWNFQQVKNSAHECYQNQQGLKHNPSLSPHSSAFALNFLYRPTTVHSASTHLRARRELWLAQVPEPTTASEDGPIELPPSIPSIFATSDEPSPLQISTSVLLTGAISVFLFRSLRRRAKRAKELKFRSSGEKKSLKEEAIESLKAMTPAPANAKGSPSPVQALLGGVSAGVIALILYNFTITIEGSLNRQTLSDNFSVRQITITIRTIVNGLCYLATFVFGLNAVGLFLYSGQLAVNSFMGDSSSEGTENKDEAQMSSNLTAESSTDSSETDISSGDQNSDGKQ